MAKRPKVEQADEQPWTFRVELTRRGLREVDDGARAEGFSHGGIRGVVLAARRESSVGRLPGPAVSGLCGATVKGERVRVAYADPPYLGCCGLYKHEHGDDGRCWNDEVTHAALIQRLCRDFPDGWALSASSPSLLTMLLHCPDDVRIAAWVKPFAVFKPNVNPAYAWEPVIWRGGRSRRGRSEPTVRDWVSAEITLKKGLTGAKPEAFCWWLFSLLGLRSSDELVDIFPGTGIVGDTWKQYQRQGKLFQESA